MERFCEKQASRDTPCNHHFVNRLTPAQVVCAQTCTYQATVFVAGGGGVQRETSQHEEQGVTKTPLHFPESTLLFKHLRGRGSFTLVSPSNFLKNIYWAEWGSLAVDIYYLNERKCWDTYGHQSLTLGTHMWKYQLLLNIFPKASGESNFSARYRVSLVFCRLRNSFCAQRWNLQNSPCGTVPTLAGLACSHTAPSPLSKSLLRPQTRALESEHLLHESNRLLVLPWGLNDPHTLRYAKGRRDCS